MFDKFPKKINLVLNLFLDNPETEFYLRDIAKRLKISPSTAKRALDSLNNEGYLDSKTRANSNFFRLKTDNLAIIELKKAKSLDMLVSSGTIDRIKKENPTLISIILFGSFAKGLNNKGSDIDILIISTSKTDYSIRDIQGHEINLIQFTPAEWRKKARDDIPFVREITTSGIALFGTLPAIDA